MARKNLNKPIVELDKPGGNLKIYWPSAKSAADYYSINQVNISYNVNGVTKQAKGHYFRFATAKEIAAYQAATNKIDETLSADTKPVEEKIQAPNIPVETIPDVVNKPEFSTGLLTPFEKMLQESKKKLTDNSNK